MVPASELLLSRSTFIPAGQKAALFAFSRSGTTTETVTALRQHTQVGLGPTVGITCRAGSAMDGIGDLTVSLPTADDQSVVMTSSFTTMLLASLMATASLADNWGASRCLRTLPGLLRSQLAEQQALGQQIGRDQVHIPRARPVLRCCLRGGVEAEGDDPGPLRGLLAPGVPPRPHLDVETGTLAVLLASERAGELERKVLWDIRNLGGKALYVGGGAAPEADIAYSVGAGLPEAARLLGP